MDDPEKLECGFATTFLACHQSWKGGARSFEESGKCGAELPHKWQRAQASLFLYDNKG